MEIIECAVKAGDVIDFFLKEEARWTGKISSLPHRNRETAEEDYYFEVYFWLYNVLMCPNLTDAIAIGCVMFT